MKVFNCPTCRVTPEITATELKCPKCGKIANGLNLPDTVTNWNNGNYTTKTVVKVITEEKPIEKAEEKPKKAEKVVKAPVKKPVQTKRTRK